MVRSNLTPSVVAGPVRVTVAGSAPRHLGSRLLAALLGLVVLLSAGTARADVGDYRIVDASKVYLGNPRLFQRPCVIQADLVYGAISEYREIVDKGLTDKDVRYHFLMKKASERFLEALKGMAREADADLVAEVGAVRAANPGVAAPVDRTDDAIARLR